MAVSCERARSALTEGLPAVWSSLAVASRVPVSWRGRPAVARREETAARLSAWTAAWPSPVNAPRGLRVPSVKKLPAMSAERAVGLPSADLAVAERVSLVSPVTVLREPLREVLSMERVGVSGLWQVIWVI